MSIDDARRLVETHMVRNWIAGDDNIPTFTIDSIEDQPMTESFRVNIIVRGCMRLAILIAKSTLPQLQAIDAHDEKVARLSSPDESDVRFKPIQWQPVGSPWNTL